MARLHIFVHEMDAPDGGKLTVSKFGKPKDFNKVVFHNSHEIKKLTIDIDQPGALCKSNQLPEDFPITIDAGNKQGYRICDEFDGSEFKYTATLEGSAPEDPIIIIEGWSVIESFGLVPALIGTAIVTFIAGAYFQHWRMKRRTQPQG